jgi:hypothetical protein
LAAVEDGSRGVDPVKGVGVANVRVAVVTAEAVSAVGGVAVGSAALEAIDGEEGRA